MKIVYASRTGNTEALVSKLGYEDTLKIEDGTESVNTPYVLFTYTDGYGDIPSEVELFLDSNSENLKGVVASGDRGHGEAFAASADKIAEKYNVPIILKVEADGTDEDVKTIKDKIAKL